MKDLFPKLTVLSLCLAAVLTVSVFVFAQAAFADAATAPATTTDPATVALTPQEVALNQTYVIAIAVMVGMGSLAAAYAVGKIGAASMGAAAEKPELLGRALIFVGLAEGIAIYGLLVGILILLLKMK